MKEQTTNKMGTEPVPKIMLGMGSLVVSLLRLCVVTLPLAWVFTKFANADVMIWFAFPIAEAVAFLAALMLMVRVNRNVIKKM